VHQLGSRYSLDHVIGRGGTGEVWCGRDGEERQVAVKILRRELVDDADIVTRFVRERRLLESVRDPHVVEVLDLVAEGETLAIVMEYVSRSDLRSHVHEQGGALAPAMAVDIARQILEALAAVHAAGVVHRDVKPENVLIGGVDDNGHASVKLSDFGVSRLIDGRTLTRLTGLIGTPRYMAPELGEGVDPSPASDIYAVGVVLYELLTGRVPFVGQHPIAILKAHAEQKPERPAGVPDPLWKVLSTLLAKAPRNRPADAVTAARLLGAIEPWLADAPVLASAALSRENTVTPGRRERTYVEDLQHQRTLSGRVWGTVRAHSRFSVALGTAFACFAGLAFTVGPGVLSGAAPATVERAWLDRYPDFVVRRDWKLTGAKGDRFQATEAIIVTSPTQLPDDSRYLQVIPKSLAAHDWQVRFASNAKPQVVQADPVFNIPLKGSMQGTYSFVSYSIRVARSGRDPDRLTKWNKALQNERNALKGANPLLHYDVPRVKEVAPQPNLADTTPVAPSQVLSALQAAGAPATPVGPLLLINGSTPVAPQPQSVTPIAIEPLTINPPTTTTTTTTSSSTTSSSTTSSSTTSSSTTSSSTTSSSTTSSSTTSSSTTSSSTTSSSTTSSSTTSSSTTSSSTTSSSTTSTTLTAASTPPSS
jgi:serine/threonine protein kinase